MTAPEEIIKKKERIIDQLITIANLVSDGILVTKADSTIIMINQKHALLDMFTMEEIIGRKLTTIVEDGFTLSCPRWMCTVWQKFWKREKPLTLKP